jgi:lipopolysaccharide biosynthesis regulator YciM
MTQKQNKHLKDIIGSISRRVDEKYRKGQKEHGGDLWLKSGMMDNAMDEVSDLVTYLYTMREQIEEAAGCLRVERNHDGKALAILDKILGKPND